MNYTSYLRLFEPIQDQLSGVYSTATLIISILLILWVLNFVVGLIMKIFSLGKTIGGFYRGFLHRYVRIFIYSFLNLFPKKKVS
ncbi:MULTISPECIES: hypothetical protein [unclassified Prochlorococcus]|uniref:hypothetical protein n=1 Tax=unclassified Prochlorococcus TaxID=2627481 RepID=UPI00053388D6|nr:MULTISPECIES: hypothetical protein [unclassified Prochlorococcus]KGG15104.1 hypothetical protein EV06_0968 [Prochlorococcus sp. MIT 0602]KGG17376.1 hypothetical protein EV07_0814 [Prochlorococcus sp. MIT 0603]